jgi:hypothetical protein
MQTIEARNHKHSNQSNQKPAAAQTMSADKVSAVAVDHAIFASYLLYRRVKQFSSGAGPYASK